MAYGLRLYSDFTNWRSGNSKRVEIHQKDYTGTSTAPSGLSAQPLVERCRASREDIDKHIMGREMEFRFHALRDGADYDFLLTAEYRDLLMITKTNGVVDFVGWIKTENITKGFIEGFYEYVLPATDGLADLKEEPYKNLSDVPYKYEESLLEIIDNARLRLRYGVGTDALPYRVILNTYETNLMNSSDCALLETYARNRRFYKIEEGKTEADSAYTAIEKVLKNFNCRLRQIHGKWYIINRNEPSSYRFNVPRTDTGFIDTANVTRESIDNIIDISSNKFKPWGDQSTVHPLKGIEVKLRNRSLGEEYTGVDEWDTEWTKSNITIDSESADHITFTMVPGTSDMYMISDVFSVAQRTDNDYMKLTFNFKTNTDIPLFNIKNDAAYFMIDLITPSETRTVFGGYMDTSVYQTLETNNIEELKVTEDGNYQIRIRFFILSEIQPDSVQMEFDGPPEITLLSVGDSGDNIADLTFDKSITIEQDGGRGVQTIETVFGDSGNTSDIGALKDSAGNLTENWSRYSEGESQPLIKLYLQNRLNNRRDYANFVTVDYYDEVEEVSPEKILKIGSHSYYEIIGYEKDHKSSQMTLRLLQIWPHTLYADI